jgi:hypothetical protein
MSYLANFFNCWRGGFRFNFKIVKTEFHSGRIAVVFQPYSQYSYASVAAPTFNNTVFLHREIIDIRETTEFSIEVPYTAVTPYLSVNPTESFSNCFGFLGVYIVNPITAPSTVSSTVTILMEVAGADDFELAVPSTNYPTVIHPTYQQSNISFTKKENKVLTNVIGSSSHITDNLMSARTCVGEKFMSVLHLLKSACVIPPVTPQTGGGSFDTEYITYAPHAIDTYTATSSSVLVSPFLKADYFNAIAPMYAFLRGGMRIRSRISGAYPSQSTSAVATTLVPLFPGSAQYFGPKTSSFANYLGGLQITQNLQFRGGFELTTPFYSPTYALSTLNLLCNNSTLGSEIDSPGGIPYVLEINFEAGSENNIDLLRQVADDFQLGLFICCPTYIKTAI